MVTKTQMCFSHPRSVCSLGEVGPGENHTWEMGRGAGLQRRLKEQPEIGPGNVEVIARRKKQPSVLNAA